VKPFIRVLEMMQAVRHGHEHLEDVARLTEAISYQSGFEHNDMADAAVAVCPRLESCLAHEMTF
jgi:hypothetical protein